MKIYPKEYVPETPKPAPTENDPTAVAKVRARIKQLMADGKPMEAAHIVDILAKEGLLSGLVDVYAVIADGGADWQVEAVAVEAPVEPKIVEK